MEERREHPRTEQSIDAAYNLPHSSDSVFQVTIINISQNGLCFLSGEEVEQDNDVRLMVNISQEEKVLFEGKTLWCENDAESGKYKVGVYISDSSFDEYERFLNSLK